jgi:dynactin-5
MKIGDHVHIGADTVVEAASIGNLVEIGKNCVIVSLPPAILHQEDIQTTHRTSLSSIQGRFSVIKDCVKIADHTIIPPGTVVASMSLYSGSPGKHRFLSSATVERTVVVFFFSNSLITYHPILFHTRTVAS